MAFHSIHKKQTALENLPQNGKSAKFLVFYFML